MTLPVALAAAPSFFTRSARAADAPAPAANEPLPRRQLGKSGPQVTMLGLGGMMAALSPDYLDIAWSMGIRYFDTAHVYLNGKSETIFAQWLAKYPERRKEIFLVTKDNPRQSPEELLTMIDKRLEACGTTYLDAFYIHGIGGQARLDWPKSDAYKKTAEALKKSGKVKMVGFSCHDAMLTDYLNAAAEGGFLDIIMLQFNPFYEKGGAFDKAMDAAHKAAPVDVREKLAFGADILPEVLARLSSRPELTESMFLSTCNRVEVFAAAPHDDGVGAATRAVRDVLAQQGGASDDASMMPYLYEHSRARGHPPHLPRRRRASTRWSSASRRSSAR